MAAAISGAASANTLHFPFFIQGFGYASQVTVTNMTAVAATVQISAYDLQGTRIGDGNLVVLGNDTLTAFLNELLPAGDSVGRLEVTSTAELSGIATVVSPYGGFALYPGAGLSTSRARLDFFEANGTYDTVLAFANTSASAGTMAITAHVGGVTLTLTRAVPARGVVAELASTLFPVDGLGAVQVDADVPIHATGILVQRFNSGFVSTIAGRPTQ
jgi:hypothetical protein